MNKKFTTENILMSNTTINERFLRIINELFNGNQRAFSQAISITPSLTSGIIGSRQSKPSFDVIEKLVFSIADINADWLVTGRGQMLKHLPGDYTAQRNVSENQGAGYNKMWDEKLKPYIRSINDILIIEHSFSKTLLNKDIERSYIPDAPEHDFSIRISGNRMADILDSVGGISNHEVLFCKLCFDRSGIEYGNMYAIVTSEGCIIRKIEKSEKEGYIRCIAFNDDINKGNELLLSDIYDLALVVGVYNMKNLQS